MSKCEFYKNQVTFLGNIILKQGIAIYPDKMSAIMDFPSLKNKTEL